jgi:ferredoxin-like protein FixX
MAVNVTDKLGVNKYHTDEHNSHIEVDKEYPDKAEVDLVVRACPAGLYSVDENGKLFFDYLGCLECGTCKLLSEGRIIKSWNYPIGTLGIEYRLG